MAKKKSKVKVKMKARPEGPKGPKGTEGVGKIHILGQTFDKGNEIVPGLWVSDLDTALNRDFIEKNGIKTVVNATEYGPFSGKPGIKQFRVPISDSKKENDILYGYLPTAVTMIEDGLDKGESVLVHCHQGISRSCSIVAAFLLKQNCQASFEDVVDYMQSRRRQAFKWGAHFQPAVEKFRQIYC